MAERTLVYLALERARAGTAAVVHVHEISDGLRARGWCVKVISTPSRSGMLKNLRRCLDVTGAQLRALVTARFDVLYLRAHPLAWPAVVCASVLGRRCVHEVNGPLQDLYVAHPVLRPLRRFLDWMQCAQYRAAAGLIAVTPELAQWLAEVSGEAAVPVRVIPNGANTHLFYPGAGADLSYRLPPRYVVFFGGLTRWHGVDCMLNAVRSDAWPGDVSLVVAGEGVESNRLAVVAAKEPRIVLLGRVPYPAIGGIVAGALAGLVPISDPLGRSQTGLAPLKLFETLACGVPVVVSDLPGQADLVRDEGCGLVFPNDSAEGLARAVAELAGDPLRRAAMGEKGAHLVRRHHSWDRRAQDTHEFLLQVLGNTLREQEH